jgi:protein-S-isoprenylcysteine O-methyltransferase Ste14
MFDEGSSVHVMKEKKGEHPYGDIGQAVLLGVFLAVWVTDSFVLHGTTFLSAHVPTYVTGSVLAVAMALLLFRSGRVVMSHKQPASVVTTGAFRYVRHPLYLAAILGCFGAAFSSLSLASLALVPAIFIFYNYIASYEEKLLEVKFGEEYGNHEERTGKWLPRTG